MTPGSALQVRPAAEPSTHRVYHVDVVAEHFASKGFVVRKIAVNGRVNTMTLSRRGQVVMTFFVKRDAVRLGHIRAVVHEYAAKR